MPPNQDSSVPISPAQGGDERAGLNTTPQIITGQQTYENPQIVNVLDAKFARTLTKASTTPSVYQNEFLHAVNTGAVTVTNFDKGSPHQNLSIKGDGFTTVQNAPNIFTNTGANKLLLAGVIYHFTRFETAPGNKIWKWYEDA